MIWAKLFTTSPKERARHNAARLVWMLLLGVSQEVAKNNAGILFGAHLTFSYPLMKNFALQNSSRKERNTIQRSPWEPPPSAGLKPHPSRLCRATLPTGEGLAKAFAVSFLFQLSSVIGREAETDVFCKSGVRATSMFASFLNLQTQNLKLSAFASCCATCRACNGALRESKGY